MCCYVGKILHCIRNGCESILDGHTETGPWRVPLEITRGSVARVPGKKHQAGQQQFGGSWGARAQYVTLGTQQKDICAPWLVPFEITEGTVVRVPNKKDQVH